MALEGPEGLEKLRRAGEIASKARDYAASLVRPGARASEVCERVEAYIRELGGLPAFPCNFSVDDVAAHYTPGIGDDVIVGEGSVVKVDVGVHVDGYIADTAATVDVGGRHPGLVEAALRALEEVLEALKPGMRIYEVGRIVEARLRREGYRPVRNLTGHNISRYTIHAGLSIPNYPDRSYYFKRLQPGYVVAIEPFATDGRGLVSETGTVNIYAYTGRAPPPEISGPESALLDTIINRYKTLPFTPRWLRGVLPDEEIVRAVKSLSAKRALHRYPVLREVSGGLVAQFEHTVYIGSREVLVLTAKTG